jgi:Domain of unknown function (DUF4357)
MSNGRNIRMFLVDGTPTGVVTAEIMNWTGHVLVAPRSQLADVIQRAEPNRTGVYFLMGPSENDDVLTVYIGESDNVGQRLIQHNRPEEKGGKDFWDRLCLVTNKDFNLTKAHVRYLEGRFIATAKDAKRANISNGTAPEFVGLPEGDVADMEFFISQLRIVLPTLGLDFLKEKPMLKKKAALSEQSLPITEVLPSASIQFEIISEKHKLIATAIEIEGEFILLAGSHTRSNWEGDRKQNTSYWKIHDRLCHEGKLEKIGDHRMLLEDTVFNSPSAASAVVFGRSDNGRKSWREKKSKKSYADWHEDQIARVAFNQPLIGD